jgi:hypothetical protein
LQGADKQENPVCLIQKCWRVLWTVLGGTLELIHHLSFDVTCAVACQWLPVIVCLTYFVICLT